MFVNQLRNENLKLDDLRWDRTNCRQLSPLTAKLPHQMRDSGQSRLISRATRGFNIAAVAKCTACAPASR